VIAQAQAAGRAGADFFQVRERDLPIRELAQLTLLAVEAVSGSRTRVIVNDRLDVALAAGAHGVHLPGQGFSPSDIRGMIPANFLVGKSIHGGEVAGAGADFAIFGTVFPSASKGPDHVAAGLDALKNAARAHAVPVLAIGGITDRNISVVAPFCGGIAAIGWFATTDAGRISESVRRARSTFESTRPVI
jgi:thiamine-phosphate pyrophosphorylase